MDAVAAADDLDLRSTVSRSAAGGELAGAPVYATVADALDGVDVLIDYTSHDVVKANALTAIEHGVAVVIGTSGLSANDYADIDAAARERGVGVIAAGNFSITAAMAQAAALLAARHLPVVGGDRLREGDQGRRAQRHRARAGRAARPGAPAGGPARGRGDGRRARGARHDDRRHAGAFAAPARRSRCRPRWCSASRTSGCRSATTRAVPRRRTWPERCSPRAPRPPGPGSRAVSTRCCSTAERYPPGV